MEIYLDNSATTRVFPEVAEVMTRVMCEDYGNPSSLHMKGVQAEQYLRNAKETFARILKVNEKEIFFTSGGTESDNMALTGCARANARQGKHLITTQIEHPAILNTMRYLESAGFRVTYLPVNAYGQISLEELRRAMTPETILVSVMHTNNEIGSLQPVAEAATLVKRMNPHTLFHVDAVQGFGKAKIYPKRMGIDLLSVSGHKIHGPKGVGLLYIGNQVKIQPIIHGGGQQMNLRSGTDNVPGIAGFAKAAELLYAHYEDDVKRLYQCKKYFCDGVRRLEGVRINGLLPGEPDGAGTAPHIVSVSISGVRSEVLLHALEEEGIYVSAGSACAARKPQPSATLKAIGIDRSLLESTIRFSFSVYTTQEELDYTLRALYDKIPMLRKYKREK
ncbi:MAG: cysteine desulfurase [Lachnospiraceae bacterium]|nr:cysteine desulfurase family protein [uncultured Acetatifactor sp.]MCI9220452.1 cysteine desulfurase [Lachnospiraceae bacterium]